MKYKVLYLILFMNTFFCYSTQKIKDSVDLTKTTTTFRSQDRTIYEIDYKLLYETQKNYSSDIIGTVYWALSSILVIILAIIGSNLFFNFKFNKKQYVELEKELIQKINNKIAEDKKDLENVFEENLKKYQIHQIHQIKELSDNYKERLDTFSENLKEQIFTLKDRIELFQKESLDSDIRINSIISEKIENLDKKIGSSIDNLHNKIENNSLELKIESQGLEADIWKFKEVYGNALTCYVAQTKFAIKANKNWKLKFSLRNIIVVINKMNILSKYDMEDINELYTIIPDEFSIQKLEIKKLVDEKPKKE